MIRLRKSRSMDGFDRIIEIYRDGKRLGQIRHEFGRPDSWWKTRTIHGRGGSVWDTVLRGLRDVIKAANSCGCDDCKKACSSCKGSGFVVTRGMHATGVFGRTAVKFPCPRCNR